MLAKRVLLLCTGFVAFFGVTAALVLSSQNEPEGIPRRLLPAYKTKIAQVKAQAEYAKAIGKEVHPIASFPSKHFDFGMLDPHTTATHTFEVANRGDAPLTIDVAKTTCKCTVGSASQGDILPGGVGRVTLSWNTGYQSESYEQKATVNTNDPLQPTIELSIAGVVKAELIAPKKIEFGSINPGESGSVDFPLYSQLWDEFVITDVTSDLPGFAYTVEPLDTGDQSLLDTQAKWAWTINARTTGDGRGSFNGEITVRLTDPGTGETVDRVIAAAGKVRAPINFYSPDIHQRDGLVIGTLQNDQPHQYALVVRARGPVVHPIEVLDVRPPMLQTSLEPLDDSKQAFRLTVTIAAGVDSAIFNREDQRGYVEIGDPNDPSYRNWFPVHGAVVDLE